MDDTVFRLPASGNATAAVTGAMWQRAGWNRHTFTSCRPQSA
jgi:hypothetical protein